jgi:hypothetical protein
VNEDTLKFKLGQKAVELGQRAMAIAQRPSHTDLAA